MPSDFTQLIADIEREAQDEGPRAESELEQLREEFKVERVDAGVRMLDGAFPASRRRGQAGPL